MSIIWFIFLLKTSMSSVKNVIPKTKDVSFGWKKYKLKHLGLEAIIKIADIVGEAMVSLQEQWAGANELKYLLKNLDTEEIYELIAIILDEDIEIIKENFNMLDFIKLVKAVKEFEDFKKIFLEVSQLINELNEKK